MPMCCSRSRTRREQHFQAPLAQLRRRSAAAAQAVSEEDASQRIKGLFRQLATTQASLRAQDSAGDTRQREKAVQKLKALLLQQLREVVNRRPPRKR